VLNVKAYSRWIFFSKRFLKYFLKDQLQLCSTNEKTFLIEISKELLSNVENSEGFWGREKVKV
jgi:hypothetical protein